MNRLAAKTLKGNGPRYFFGLINRKLDVRRKTLPYQESGARWIPGAQKDFWDLAVVLASVLSEREFVHLNEAAIVRATMPPRMPASAANSEAANCNTE